MATPLQIPGSVRQDLRKDALGVYQILAQLPAQLPEKTLVSVANLLSRRTPAAVGVASWCAATASWSPRSAAATRRWLRRLDRSGVASKLEGGPALSKWGKFGHSYYL